MVKTEYPLYAPLLHVFSHFFFIYVCLCPQGFLSDLLEKANRHYDDQKLQEYTQTIVILILRHGLTHTLRHNGEAHTSYAKYNCTIYSFYKLSLFCRVKLWNIRLIIFIFIDFHNKYTEFYTF